MSNQRTVARTARKLYNADCGHFIKPGERYLSHVQLPGDDPDDYANAAGHPVRMRECGICATRYGRAELLGVTA